MSLPVKNSKLQKKKESTRLDTLFLNIALCEHAVSTIRPYWGWGSKPCGLVHSAHAAHAGVGRHRGFGFFDVAHDALGGQQHTGNGSGVVNYINKKPH